MFTINYLFFNIKVVYYGLYNIYMYVCIHLHLERTWDVVVNHFEIMS